MRIRANGRKVVHPHSRPYSLLCASRTVVPDVPESDSGELTPVHEEETARMRYVLAFLAVHLPTCVLAVNCGREGEPTCTTSPADYVRSALCDDGQFYDPREGGECWSCPPGTFRGVDNIESEQACISLPSENFRSARHVRDNTMVGQGCPSGAFWDVQGPHGPTFFGSCWSCDGWRRTGYHIRDEQGRACVQSVGAGATWAKWHKNVGCSAPEFWDPRNGGECWSCPQGFQRTGSVAPVNYADACVAARPCADGLVKVNGTCQFDPRPTHCGREGQAACKLWEFIPSCADGLMESPAQGGTCVQPPPGVDPFWGTLLEVGEQLAQSPDRRACQDEILSSTANLDGLLPDPVLSLIDGPMAQRVGVERNRCVREVIAGFTCEVPYILDNFHALFQLADAEQAIQAIERDYNKWRTSQVCQDAVRNSPPELASTTEVSCALGLMAIGDKIDEYACAFGLLGDPGLTLRTGSGNANLCVGSGRVAYMFAESQLQDKITDMLSAPMERRFAELVAERRRGKLAQRQQAKEDELIAEADHPLSPDEVDEIQQFVDSRGTTDDLKAQEAADFLDKLHKFKNMFSKAGLIIDISPTLMDRAASLPPCHLNIMGTVSYSQVQPDFIPVTFQLRSPVSGKCMAASDGSGSGQTQWPCDETNRQQHYEAAHTGGGNYRIRNVAFGRCLGVDGARMADGTELSSAICDQNAQDQRWKVETFDNQRVRLVAAHSSKCVDLDGGATNDGARLVQWRCVDQHPNQQFEMLPLAASLTAASLPPFPQNDIPAHFAMRVRASAKCMDVGGGNNGEQRRQSGCNAQISQAYSAVPVGDGSYQIRSASGGRCMGVDGNSLENGASVISWDCQDQDVHKWDALETGSGAVQLRNRNSGKCLDLSGGSGADGAGFVQWDCVADHDNQSFSLLPVDPNAVPRRFLASVRASYRCLDMGGVGDNGSPINQWDCRTDNPNQFFEAIPGGYPRHYFIRSEASGRCLGVTGDATENMAPITNWDCNPDPRAEGHNWEFIRQSDGTYRIKLKHSGKCMDLAGGKTENGTQFVQYDCVPDHPNQSFTVEALD